MGGARQAGGHALSSGRTSTPLVPTRDAPAAQSYMQRPHRSCGLRGCSQPAAPCRRRPLLRTLHFPSPDRLGPLPGPLPTLSLALTSNSLAGHRPPLPPPLSLPSCHEYVHSALHSSPRFYAPTPGTDSWPQPHAAPLYSPAPCTHPHDATTDLKTSLHEHSPSPPAISSPIIHSLLLFTYVMQAGKRYGTQGQGGSSGQRADQGAERG